MEEKGGGRERKQREGEREKMERKEGKGEGREGREKEVTLQFSYTMKARNVTFKKKIKTTSQKRIKKREIKKEPPRV